MRIFWVLILLGACIAFSPLRPSSAETDPRASLKQETNSATPTRRPLEKKSTVPTTLPLKEQQALRAYQDLPSVPDDVIVPRLKDREPLMVVTAWCEDCKGLSQFFRKNGIAYYYGFVKKDSPEIALSQGKLAIGTPVYRIPFRKPELARRSVAQPMCALIARAIEAESAQGGCVAVFDSKALPSLR